MYIYLIKGIIYIHIYKWLGFFCKHNEKSYNYMIELFLLVKCFLRHFIHNWNFSKQAFKACSVNAIPFANFYYLMQFECNLTSSFYNKLKFFPSMIYCLSLEKKNLIHAILLWLIILVVVVQIYKIYEWLDFKYIICPVDFILLKSELRSSTSLFRLTCH